MKTLAQTLESVENMMFEVSGDSYSYIGKVYADDNGISLYEAMPTVSFSRNRKGGRKGGKVK